MVRAGVPCKTIQVVLKTRTVSGSYIALAGNRVVGKELPPCVQTRNFHRQDVARLRSRTQVAKIDVRNDASEIISERAHQCAELSGLPKSLVALEGIALEIVEYQPAVLTHTAEPGCLTAARKTCYQHNLLSHRNRIYRRAITGNWALATSSASPSPWHTWSARAAGSNPDTSDTSDKTRAGSLFR